ncbi:MAG: hypothetical protein K2U26_17965 [Cyclobacteriaceae bacterium]|nr:hypothetical protein [Cyclobacteriaceae bacterium]
MKLYSGIVLIVITSFSATAQDFDKNLATAKSSYSSGNLEDARFAMEQMLHDLDMAIGKEILKMLPAKMGSLASDPKQDNLTGGSGMGTGLFVHRTYGATPKIADLEIVNNSPLMNSIGAILNTPILGGMMRDENQKVVKIQGYKSLLNKSLDSETGKTNYELQIPINNTLVMLKVDDTTEGEITGFANTIPLAKIATLAQ